MKTEDIFDGLLSALKVGDTASVIARRRDEIAKALNKDFARRMAAATTNSWSDHSAGTRRSRGSLTST